MWAGVAQQDDVPVVSHFELFFRVSSIGWNASAYRPRPVEFAESAAGSQRRVRTSVGNPKAERIASNHRPPTQPTPTPPRRRTTPPTPTPATQSPRDH